MERSTGELLLGPPKSRAGRRVVGIPDAIVPVLREHLSIFVEDEPGALVFPGLERVTGIEPALSAWEADVLPLNYTRAYQHRLVMEPA